MNISKALDCFKTVYYNNLEEGGDIMVDFMSHSFKVMRIDFAGKVMSVGNPMHRNRQFHGLALHISGDKDYDFSGNILKVRDYELVYMPKGSDYYVTVNEPGTCYCVNFDIAESACFTPFVFKPKNKLEFAEIYKRMDRVWKSKSTGFEMKCMSELYSLLYNMQKEYEVGYTPGSKKELIRPALEYIHENYTTGLIGISFLSEMCGITPEYFRRVFRACYGTSPVKYINDLKITRAKELMLSGKFSVSQAAQLSGFSDISYFSREFKKSVGTPPSLFVTENE